MRGFAAYFLGCTIVAALTLIAPEHARWIGLSILAALFVASALPRRSLSKPRRRAVQPRRERGY